MELIGYFGSPFVRRVAVTLRLQGLDYRHRSWMTVGDAERLRALNPLGRVPALVLDDGEVLIDSLMIIDWIDEQAGERALVPRSGAGRRRVNRLVALGQGVMEKYVAAYYERTRRPETHLWQPWLDWVEGQIAGGLAALESMVEGPWMTGAAISHADVVVACAILAIREDMPSLAPPGRYPALDALTVNAERLPAFVETRP